MRRVGAVAFVVAAALLGLVAGVVVALVFENKPEPPLDSGSSDVFVTRISDATTRSS